MDNPNLPSEQNERAERKFAEPTPGPWRVLPNNNGCNFWIVGKSGSAVVTGGFDEYDNGYGVENRDDARLMAAAPDMLAALRECADDLASEIEARYSHGIKDHPAMTPKYERDMAPVIRARAAIAKATGG